MNDAKLVSPHQQKKKILVKCMIELAKFLKYLRRAISITERLSKYTYNVGFKCISGSIWRFARILFMITTQQYAAGKTVKWHKIVSEREIISLQSIVDCSMCEEIVNELASPGLFTP